MLFRIEDISGFDPKLRTYDVDEFTAPFVDKQQVDEHIALKIREEINGLLFEVFSNLHIKIQQVYR